jgi:hypothetical protein
MKKINQIYPLTQQKIMIMQFIYMRYFYTRVTKIHPPILRSKKVTLTDRIKIDFTYIKPNETEPMLNRISLMRSERMCIRIFERSIQ